MIKNYFMHCKMEATLFIRFTGINKEANNKEVDINT